MKLQAEALGIKHRTNLADALEDDGKVTSTNHARNIKVHKDARYLAQGIKYIEGIIINSGTSFFPRTLND